MDDHRKRPTRRDSNIPEWIKSSRGPIIFDPREPQRWEVPERFKTLIARLEETGRAQANEAAPDANPPGPDSDKARDKPGDD
jgi:hypothetical protein